MAWQGATFSPLEAALALAACGIPVCPFHHPTVDRSGWMSNIVCSCGRLGCLQPCAHPVPPAGLGAATTDPDQIRSWWQDLPDANVGLVTGVACDVVDTDPDTGRRALKALARHQGGLGPVARTGTGRWLFFTAPSDRPGDVLVHRDDGLADTGPHVRWRGRHGSVLAPPSRTLLGHEARWVHPFATALPDLSDLAQVVSDLVHEEPSEPSRLAWLVDPVRWVRSRVSV
jgi:Bifunctional DNA primase/polymerase, N-terminal